MLVQGMDDVEAKGAVSSEPSPNEIESAPENADNITQPQAEKEETKEVEGEGSSFSGRISPITISTPATGTKAIEKTDTDKDSQSQTEQSSLASVVLDSNKGKDELSKIEDGEQEVPLFLQQHPDYHSHVLWCLMPTEGSDATVPADEAAETPIADAAVLTEGSTPDESNNKTDENSAVTASASKSQIKWRTVKVVKTIPKKRFFICLRRSVMQHSLLITSSHIESCLTKLRPR